MTYKVMVIDGYNLTDMGDNRDRFKRILKLLEFNSIYGNSLHSIFLQFPNSTKNSRQSVSCWRIYEHSIILKTQSFPCIRSRFSSKYQTTDIKMLTVTK